MSVTWKIRYTQPGSDEHPVTLVDLEEQESASVVPMRAEEKTVFFEQKLTGEAKGGRVIGWKIC